MTTVTVLKVIVATYAVGMWEQLHSKCQDYRTNVFVRALTFINYKYIITQFESLATYYSFELVY